MPPRRLQHGLRPAGAYWSAHRYDDPLAPYASYRYDLAAPPSLAVEQWAQLLRAALLPRWPRLRDAETAEWRARPGNPPHPRGDRYVPAVATRDRTLGAQVGARAAGRRGAPPALGLR